MFRFYMQLVKGLECPSCHNKIPFSPDKYSSCCFSPYNPFYNPSSISRDSIEDGPKSLFRYRAFLPSDSVSKSGVGLTALTKSYYLGKALGLNGLYIKDEDEPNTGTFKDRGVGVAAQKVIEFNLDGHNYISLGGTSTGNLSSAVAAKASELGLKSIVLIHGSAEESLIRKTASFGGYVLVVNGMDYSDMNAILQQINEQTDFPKQVAWINSELRPIYSQGSKTIGFEIAEQLGWKAPDNIIYPVAAGLSFWQVYKGLQEFEKFGLIDNLKTRMHAVQNSECSPIVNAWNYYLQKGQLKVMPVRKPKKSLAETLSVGDPANGADVLETIKLTNGSATAVTDSEIQEGMSLIALYTNLVPGPVSGAVVAAAKKLAGNKIDPDSLTVLVLTDSYKKGRPDIVGTGNGTLIEVSDRKSIEDTISRILSNSL